ncbi:hypothetical protein HK099_007252 [Clydaea vesicula]|uniref:Uncharacterized protein n=1 Tax=Clydaea vesicula TaxID=447962 RepID=A0AAD5U5I9_9FUNG|nr:hypothetical protein HK099_007252 [Clydaea vesicula]
MSGDQLFEEMLRDLHMESKAGEMRKLPKESKIQLLKNWQLQKRSGSVISSPPSRNTSSSSRISVEKMSPPAGRSSVVKISQGDIQYPKQKTSSFTSLNSPQTHTFNSTNSTELNENFLSVLNVFKIQEQSRNHMLATFDNQKKERTIENFFQISGNELLKLFDAVMEEMSIFGKAKDNLIRSTSDNKKREVILQFSKNKLKPESSRYLSTTPTGATSFKDSAERGESLLYSIDHFGRIPTSTTINEMSPKEYVLAVASRNTPLKILFRILTELQVSFSINNFFTEKFLNEVVEMQENNVETVKGIQCFTKVLQRLFDITSNKLQQQNASNSVKKYYGGYNYQVNYHQNYADFGISEDELRLESLKCIQLLMRSGLDGWELVVQQEDLIKQVVFCLGLISRSQPNQQKFYTKSSFAKDKSSKKSNWELDILIFDVLTIICSVSFEGHRLILKSFEELRVLKNSKSRFGCIVKYFFENVDEEIDKPNNFKSPNNSVFVDDDDFEIWGNFLLNVLINNANLEMKCSVLTFINSLMIPLQDDTNARLNIRKDLESSHLHSILKKLDQDIPPLEFHDQMQIFEEDRQYDLSIMESEFKKKNLEIFQDLNLSDILTLVKNFDSKNQYYVFSSLKNFTKLIENFSTNISKDHEDIVQIEDILNIFNSITETFFATSVKDSNKISLNELAVNIHQTFKEYSATEVFQEKADQQADGRQRNLGALIIELQNLRDKYQESNQIINSYKILVEELRRENQNVKKDGKRPSAITVLNQGQKNRFETTNASGIDFHHQRNSYENPPQNLHRISTTPLTGHQIYGKPADQQYEYKPLSSSLSTLPSSNSLQGQPLYGSQPNLTISAPPHSNNSATFKPSSSVSISYQPPINSISQQVPSAPGLPPGYTSNIYTNNQIIHPPIYINEVFEKQHRRASAFESNSSSSPSNRNSFEPPPRKDVTPPNSTANQSGLGNLYMQIRKLEIEIEDLKRENLLAQKNYSIGKIRVSDLKEEDLLKVEKFIVKLTEVVPETVSDKSSTDTKAIPPLPPPPPAPLGGPPPPPGPPPPAVPAPPGFKGHTNHKKSKVPLKNLQWKKIKGEGIWKDVSTNKNFVSLLNDEEEISELFSKTATKKNAAKENVKAAEKPTVTIINLLKSDRSRNIAIMLAGLRKSNSAILEAILKIDDNALSEDNLMVVRQYVPTEEEVEIVRNFDGDVNLLGEAEKYIRVISNCTRLPQRLDCMIFRKKLANELREVIPDLDAVQSACEQLRASSLLQNLLHCILELGNYLNGDTFRGNATGFQVNGLLTLRDTKSNSKKYPTLLHYLVDKTGKLHPETLNYMKELSSVSLTSRVCIPALLTTCKNLSVGLENIKNEINEMKNILAAYPNESDFFVTIMNDFFLQYESKISSVKTTAEIVEKSVKEIIIYFGDDFRERAEAPEDFFGIFCTFNEMIQCAKKENEIVEKKLQKAINNNKKHNVQKTISGENSAENGSASAKFASDYAPKGTFLQMIKPEKDGFARLKPPPGQKGLLQRGTLRKNTFDQILKSRKTVKKENSSAATENIALSDNKIQLSDKEKFFEEIYLDDENDTSLAKIVFGEENILD